MALKDWKKTKDSNSYILWENAKTDDWVKYELDYKKQHIIGIQMKPYKWFDYKVDALAYAKKYMRSH